MAARIPVLQIIHITDLHISKGAGDKVLLAQQRRWLRLRIRKWIEEKNFLEWHEGTLDHDDTAEPAFNRFLVGLKTNSKEWFSEEKSESLPQTWLVNTGDLTTFGDRESMKSGWQMQETWCATLGGKKRLIFGNHDAWPSTLPGLTIGDNADKRIEAQKSLVAQRDDWKHRNWFNPLVIDIPQADARIELYALNSVCFGPLDNTRALGRLQQEDLDQLREWIKERYKHSPKIRRRYRILATHHPLAFPFTSAETKSSPLTPFIRSMLLTNAKEAIEFLKNDSCAEATKEFIPYVHLLLAGHTHLAFPGCQLPKIINEAYQAELGTSLLQLVGGPLWLVRDRERVRQNSFPKAKLRNRKAYAQPWVFDANQQFQVLRFYYDPDSSPNGLTLQRSVLARSPNDGDYRSVPELKSSTFVRFSPLD